MSEKQQLEKENQEGAINRLTRRVDELRKDLDIVIKRSETQQQMIEEVLASLASLKQFTISTRQHTDLKTEEVKDEIKETESILKDKVKDVKEVLEKKKIIKIIDNGIFRNLLFWKK